MRLTVEHRGQPEHEPAQHRRQHEGDEHPHRGLVGQHGILEGQPHDEQGHGEADAGQRGTPQHLTRADALRQGPQSEAGTPERADPDADELADDQAEHDAPGHRGPEGVGEETAAQVDAGVGQGEHGDDDVAGPGQQHDLQPLVDRHRPGDRLARGPAHLGHRGLAEGREPARGLLHLGAPGRERRDAQAGQHPGDRGVHPGGERGPPDDEREPHVRPGPPDPEPAGEDQADEARRRQEEGHDVEVLRVRDADDADRDDVVEDHQGEEEHPQLGGRGRADERQGPEEERGVAADDDAPPVGRLPAGVHRQVEQGRQHQPADAGEHGQDEAAPLGELADGEVAAHLEADDEEEQRHQAVVDPVAEVHRQLRAAEADGELGVPELLVGPRPPRVRPEEGQDRGREEHRGAAGLGAQEAAQR